MLGYSDLAETDLERLRAEGLRPTDADIVRLHALAAKLSDGPETTAWNAPRFAIAGNAVFWEPTVAARLWYARAEYLAEDGPSSDWLFAYACAHGRDPGHLEGLAHPADIGLALDRWVRSLTATPDEVDRAVRYAAGGYAPEPEPTELAKKRGATQDPSADLERLLAAAAANTGIPWRDLLAQTPSALCGIMDEAYARAGIRLSCGAARAHADYLATLGAVRKRLRSESGGAASDGVKLVNGPDDDDGHLHQP